MVSRYARGGDTEWTQSEKHLFFASHILSGTEVPDTLLRSLPKPISKLAPGFASERQSGAAISAHPMVSVVSQPEDFPKALLAAEVGLRFGRSIFVETGTNIGQSTVMVSGLFSQVLSVEADAALATCAQTLVSSMKIGNVEIHEGDSVRFLQQLTGEQVDSAVFFLDAHYSRGLTSRVYGVCPLEQELAVIFGKSDRPVVVADDVRDMTGRKGFPSLVSVLRRVPGEMNVNIVHDQLVITPADRN